MKTLRLIILLLLPALGMAEVDCQDSLKELLGKDPKGQETLKEFLNLQAGISLHKLAYASLRSSSTAEEFRLEGEILKLLKKRQDKASKEPDFKKLVSLFEDPNNRVSRNALAKAMPYIAEALNDQKKEQNVFERKMFNLGQADIKMIALLAERERVVSGRYDSKFYKDPEDDRSILNFMKIINSSVRNSGGKKRVSLERMLERIKTLQDRASRLLTELDLSKECAKLLVGNCVLRNDSQKALEPSFAASLLQISEELQFPEMYERLRYDDVWLYTGKGAVGEPVRRKKRKKADKKTIEEAAEREALSEDEAKNILNRFYAKKVLEAAPTLFTEAELLENPAFARAFARALDEGVLSKKGKERNFIFEGQRYYVPELWNNETREEGEGKLEWAWNKALSLKDKVDGWWPVKKTRRFFQGLGIEALELAGVELEENFDHVRKEDLPDFLSVWNKQKNAFGHEFSFSFKNKLYDIRTGQELKGGVSSFLTRFKAKNGKIKEPTDPLKKENVIKLAAKEALLGNEALIADGEAYHITGAKVDFERVYKKAKKSNKEISIESSGYASKNKVEKLAKDKLTKAETLKTLADGKRSFFKEGKTYDLFKGAALTRSEAQNEIAANRRRQGVNRTPSDYASMDDDYVFANASASLNREPVFALKGKRYHTYTGRAVASAKPNSAVAGFKNHDAEIETLSSLELSGDPKELLAFHEQKYGKCESYGVLDKSNNTLLFYDSKKARLLWEAEVLLGRNVGDKATRYSGGLEGPKSNGHTAAGVFELGAELSGPPKRLFANTDLGPAVAFSVAGPEKSNLLKDGDKHNNRSTDGSILMMEEDFARFLTLSAQGCPFYVLPETASAGLKAQGERIALKLLKEGEKLSEYASSRAGREESKEIRIKVSSEVELNEASKRFLRSLERNKPKIMRDLGISNAEYNELAKIAFGVMGVESQFGEGLKVFPDGFSIKNFLNPRRHKEKSYGGAVVFLGKLLSRGEVTVDPDSRSRGLTQIKAVEDYPLIKKFGGIDRESLMDPEKAAVATMYVLGEMLSRLEKEGAKHSAIGEANKMNYLYYVYNGQSSQISGSSATPELNSRARKVAGYADLVDVFTR